MSTMSTPQEPDPELQQLGGMLENILDIQHPQRVQERLKKTSESKKGKIYSVQKKEAENNISSLHRNVDLQTSLKTNEFYSLD